MTEKAIRIRIPPVLYKKYRTICSHLDLSIPKQTAEMIREFVKVHEKNVKILSTLEKEE